MNYDFFLFCKLYDAMVGIDYYYDALFEDLKELYEKFNNSSHNNPNTGLYECIETFFKDNHADIIKKFTRHRESLGIKHINK
jgi:hypothetical protein